jgi:predicted TIM-barrel fold metal-dependent hydrolase
MPTLRSSSLLVVVVVLLWTIRAGAQKPPAPLYNDSHVHLTNYVQEGPDIRDFLRVMGDKVGRATLFGIPLQQQWMYSNTGEFAPWYYLQTDAPLYYYSFTDAQIALAYRSLPPDEQARFDPMITGFNPTDMYAADHIRRVLTLFPGVFEGIGEFSIHKEFVSSKISGETATLGNRALDRILDFAAEVGMPVLFHCDVDMPFPKPGQDPYLVVQLRELVLRHPKATIIWAHAGVGRIVHPVADHLGMLERALGQTKESNLLFDLSWDETAKYVDDPAHVDAVAAVINRHPDRFLFGTDEVAPEKQADYLKVYRLYQPLLARLTPAAREAFLRGNYERVFDRARRNVRAWEAAHVRPARRERQPTPSSGGREVW